MIINPFPKGESIKMVFVYNQDGSRLMPTHPAKARILLKKKLAKIVRIYPFTIKLNYLIENPVYQEITIGIDPGTTIGISITTNKRVLFEAKLEQRTDIPKLLETKRNARRTRRNRLRYRKPRFNNRRNKYNQVDKWLPPSLQASLLTYVNLVQFFDKLVPISKVRYEYNNFDIQKLKDPNIQGTDYQHGTLYQEENIKAYVRTRDNHTCQKCNTHGKDLPKGIQLEVHHILPVSKGGTTVPNNLITLCSKCHKQVHNDLKNKKLVKLKIPNYKEATKLNILKDLIYEELTKLRFVVEITYGYETKIKRQQLKLEKDHHIDARVIANGKMKRSRNDTKIYLMKKIRNHNRKIFKDNILKGNIKKRNQCEYTVYGFRRYDIVKYDNQFWYINALGINGSFQLKQLNSNKVTRRMYKKLKLIQKRNKYIWSWVLIHTIDSTIPQEISNKYINGFIESKQFLKTLDNDGLISNAIIKLKYGMLDIGLCGNTFTSKNNHKIVIEWQVKQIIPTSIDEATEELDIQCNNNNIKINSMERQVLIKRLKEYINQHYYACTLLIFENNIFKNQLKTKYISRDYSIDYITEQGKQKILAISAKYK